MMEFFASPYSGEKALLDCLANKIVKPDLDWRDVPLHHFWKLFVICGSLLFAFLYVLLFEVLFLRLRMD